MSHLHNIYDMDRHFIINPLKRVITAGDSMVKRIIQYDHNSERFTFEIPRIVEGHDMAKTSKIEIHYSNISSDGRSKKNGVYESTDISADDDDNVVFSWLISKDATQIVGDLIFAIRFVCLNNDGELDYAWGTLPNADVKVTESVYYAG